jgi:hypothetical protein
MSAPPETEHAMFILSLILSFFTFTQGGPSTEIERNVSRHVLETAQPQNINPCAGTGCR